MTGEAVTDISEARRRRVLAAFVELAEARANDLDIQTYDAALNDAITDYFRAEAWSIIRRELARYQQDREGM